MYVLDLGTPCRTAIGIVWVIISCVGTEGIFTGNYVVMGDGVGVRFDCVFCCTLPIGEDYEYYDLWNYLLVVVGRSVVGYCWVCCC